MSFISKYATRLATRGKRHHPALMHLYALFAGRSFLSLHPRERERETGSIIICKYITGKFARDDDGSGEFEPPELKLELEVA